MEDGYMDQHEASVKIGQVLKELYIDSALQQEKKQNEKDKRNAKKDKRPKNNLSWEQYKKLNE